MTAGRINYITIAELSNTIRNNFHRIPHDVDFVIGIPRSGTLCASIISEFLNRPLSDIESFCNGLLPHGGVRLSYWNYGRKEEDKQHKKNKVLVVDDAMAKGDEIRKQKERLKPFEDEYEFVWMVIYYAGPADRSEVDLYLEDISGYQHTMFEWNIFHNLVAIMGRSIWDMDGVLCAEPPDDYYKDRYETYIKDALPLFIPSLPIGEVLTYRINAYRDVTEKWLNEHGVKYNKLIMFKAKTREERNNSGVTSQMIKAEYYKQQPWAIMFFESDDRSSEYIARVSGKPCYCTTTNKMYYGQ